ncbi:ADP-ribosylation/Crystallin J1 [Mycena epipterygia]|nr:ADP-ribosylation/Crystallin J1 [Mycena epipterygia]
MDRNRERYCNVHVPLYLLTRPLSWFTAIVSSWTELRNVTLTSLSLSVHAALMNPEHPTRFVSAIYALGQCRLTPDPRCIYCLPIGAALLISPMPLLSLPQFTRRPHTPRRMEATSPMPRTLPLPLHRQLVVPAAPSMKIRLALLAAALCDAFGGPAEFHARFSFVFVAHMVPNDNFRSPKGAWTDDTSMALALGRAVARGGGREANANSTSAADGASAAEGDPANDGFDEATQLDAYFRWWQDGMLSATGHCFAIGNTIQRAVSIYRDALKESNPTSTTTTCKLPRCYPRARRTRCRRPSGGRGGEKALARIGRDLKGAVFGGNGSLMRVLRSGSRVLARRCEKVEAYARRSIAVTHPNARRRRRVHTSNAQYHPTRLTKLDHLHHFAAYPWTAPALRTALAAEVPLLAGLDVRADPKAAEAYHAVHHPIFRLVDRDADGNDDTAVEAPKLALLPQAAALPSSGYVVHTLAAALYALLAARTFEGGALLAANMGDDADTVAAVYGGLAGMWYVSAEVRVRVRV